MPSISTTNSLLHALKELPNIENSYFGEDVVIAISDSDGNEIVKFEILGDDLPVVSKVSQQVINSRLLMKRALLESELRSINAELGSSDNKTETSIERAVRLASQVYPNAYPANKEEAILIEETLASNQGRGAVMNDSYSEKIIEACFRVDSKTSRLICQGYIVFDGKVIFESSDDALEYLNANGFNCTDFIEAHNAGEEGVIEACWHENFIALYES